MLKSMIHILNNKLYDVGVERSRKFSLLGSYYNLIVTCKYLKVYIDTYIYPKTSFSHKCGDYINKILQIVKYWVLTRG